MTILPIQRLDSDLTALTPPLEELGLREREFDEVEVMRRLASGDTAALQQIMDIFWDPLGAYASRVLDDVDGAKDVVQTAFVRLWDRRADWRPGSLRSYLFRLTRNLALDAIRAERARAQRQRAKGMALAPSPRTPAEALESDHVRTQVDRAIQALPYRRREVFTLAYLQGLSYRQIAEIMGISNKTVGNQMTNALAELRVALAPLLESEPTSGDLDDVPGTDPG